MRTGRLEAFSDGVLAIIITIMVLELRVPEGHDLSGLLHETGGGLLTYLLSFVYIAIYWTNHHHMFHLVETVRGEVLWANLVLLFCLSLLPFTTAWMDESGFARTPVIVYGLNLTVTALAYLILQTLIIRRQGPVSPLRQAVGGDLKGKASPLFYLAGMLTALLSPIVAVGLYAAGALLWLVPDPRIDRMVRERESIPAAT